MVAMAGDLGDPINQAKMGLSGLGSVVVYR